MTMQNKNEVKTKVTKSAIKLLVDKFYKLRKTFEAVYSGKLRSYKYEATRDFTIALNHAIFQVNQLEISSNKTINNLKNLELQLEELQQNFVDLVN